MKNGRMGWAERGVRTLLPGVGLWAVLAVAAGAYAVVAGRPLLPLIVTLDECVAAIFFIAPLVLLLLSVARTEEPEHRAASRWVRVAHRLGWTALTLFLMALLTRGIFGLGWKPF